MLFWNENHLRQKNYLCYMHLKFYNFYRSKVLLSVISGPSEIDQLYWWIMLWCYVKLLLKTLTLTYIYIYIYNLTLSFKRREDSPCSRQNREQLVRWWHKLKNKIGGGHSFSQLLKWDFAAQNNSFWMGLWAV